MRPISTWVKRIGVAVVLWAGICWVSVLWGMSPRPALLAGVVAAVSVATWMTTDSIGLAQSTDWQVGSEPVSRTRGADVRVVALERLLADSPTSPSARQRLQQLVTELVDERLLSLRAIDRRLDPLGARAALGPDLDDFINGTDRGRTQLAAERMSMFLNRIESL